VSSRRLRRGSAAGTSGGGKPPVRQELGSAQPIRPAQPEPREAGKSFGRQRVLLVSLGSIGKRHLRNTRTLLPNAEIAVHRQHHLGDIAVPDGADHLITDAGGMQQFAPHAVIISSPATAHVELARSFLDRGVHAFIEKPLAESRTAAVSLRGMGTAPGGPYAMVGYVLRFQPILAWLKEWLATGGIGRILTARVEVGQYLPDWRPQSDYREGVSARRSLGGGALLELSHEIDYATWIFGMPDSIYCSSDHVSDLDIDVEDSACVIMEYGQGRPARRVVVQVDFLQRVPTMAVQVVGAEGTLRADLIAERAEVLRPGAVASEILDVPRMDGGNEMYLRQFDHFFQRSIAGYRPRYPDSASRAAPASIDRGIEVVHLVDLAKRSAQEGRRLAVETGS